MLVPLMGRCLLSPQVCYLCGDSWEYASIQPPQVSEQRRGEGASSLQLRCTHSPQATCACGNILNPCDLQEVHALVSEVLADQSTIVSADSDVAQSALLTMVRHPYANFVVQTLVDVASEEQRTLMKSLLSDPALKRAAYGKHVVARLARATGMYDQQRRQPHAKGGGAAVDPSASRGHMGHQGGRGGKAPHDVRRLAGVGLG